MEDVDPPRGAVLAPLLRRAEGGDAIWVRLRLRHQLPRVAPPRGAQAVRVARVLHDADADLVRLISHRERLAYCRRAGHVTVRT